MKPSQAPITAVYNQNNASGIQMDPTTNINLNKKIDQTWHTLSYQTLQRIKSIEHGQTYMKQNTLFTVSTFFLKTNS